MEMLTADEAEKRRRDFDVHERYKGSNLTRTVLSTPVAGSAFYKMCSALAFENKVQDRLRELVILRTAWRVSGHYVLAQHLMFSRFLGIPNDQIFGVMNPDACAGYSDLDRSVIRMADELIDDATASARTLAELEGTLPSDEVLELLLAGGYWRMVSTVTSSAQIPLDDGVEPWPEKN